MWMCSFQQSVGIVDIPDSLSESGTTECPLTVADTLILDEEDENCPTHPAVIPEYT